MLTEICAEIRNYFLRDYRKDIHEGTFTISDRRIESLSFLQDGQYYRIVGSVFNDGVHKYGDVFDPLVDETFSGAVWAMAVPPAVIALDSKIASWIDENRETLNSPYQSESFGGYSYSKSTGGSGGDDVPIAYSWENQFAKELNPYRRISIL